ncbi:MAG TPA: hypothetical protein PKK36_02570 [Kiritimatiellia bacterium]|nr:hypothetical protein [Kiritimatiellia bacterium]HNR93472.1 hypothetical protein [Kiritimatiellia bacterium]HPA78048.1 hypothetical protein [Kiritimatiellia bacterium]HQQ04164.1 hypothetical protein [Kiritimatiellia bacterium]
MNVETFFRHWGLEEDPFQAEEARNDQVYLRTMGEMTHPDFDKIFGSPRDPGTAVVFGDKGSGKTAIRLLIEKRLEEHNRDCPNEKVWVVRCDDLNPLIDRVLHSTGHKEATTAALKEIRLEDHMDYILSLSITRLIDFLLGDKIGIEKARRARRRLRRMSRQNRIDFAELAMIYDQAKGSKPMERWHRIRSILRINPFINQRTSKSTIAFTVLAAAAFASGAYLYGAKTPLMFAGLGVSLVSTLWLIYAWIRQFFKVAALARKLKHEVRIMDRTTAQLRAKLLSLSPRVLDAQPLPVPGASDSRYELTSRLMRILKEVGYVSMVVLFDRVDEPVSVNGQPDKMKAIVWPMLNNKFLQQSGVGVKLLLPLDLGHRLKREDTEFFQQARLDKQNMIERLTWTGATLYDLANQRIQSCVGEGEYRAKRLNDFFDSGVTTQDLVDALDQMHQPRDAFKFLYSVIQEHCRNVSDSEPVWQIPKLMLDQMRRQQSQRLQEFYRGLSPA